MEEHITNTILKHIPDAKVFAQDYKGGDHFEVVVVSSIFKEMKLIDQHRKVMDLFKEEFKEVIHAFSLKTMTFEQFEKLNKD